MRRSIFVLLAGLAAVSTGCPKKTSPNKTSPDGGVTKTDAGPAKTGGTKKTRKTPTPPRKPAFVPPAKRNLTLELKVRSEAGGQQSFTHDLTLVRTPVTDTKRVRFSMSGLPNGKTQQLELEVADGDVVNGSDASLLGFLQQVMREGRRLLPTPGGRVVYLPGGGFLQQKHEKPTDVPDTYEFAGRECHGKRISAVSRGRIVGGEPFKGKVNLELWRDPETAEVLALRGTAFLDFRDQGRVKLSYRLEASTSAAGASGGDPGEYTQAFEAPESLSVALTAIGSLATAAAMATRLQKDAGGWLPAGMLATAIAGSGALRVNAARPTLTQGKVEKKRAEPARTVIGYSPQQSASGMVKLVPTVFTDDADYLIRFGDGTASRTVRVSKAEYDKAREGDPFDLSKAEVEAKDPHVGRAATAAEVKTLEAARKAGKPVAEVK